MTVEQKDLLLKDLCSRLPYGVKVWFPDWLNGYTSTIESIDIDGYITDFEGTTWEISDCKPYLFPISSMSEEQEIEFLNTCVSQNPLCWTLDTFKWLNKNHFDYNYLIDDYLAIDATGKNIY